MRLLRRRARRESRSASRFSPISTSAFTARTQSSWATGGSKPSGATRGSLMAVAYGVGVARRRSRSDGASPRSRSRAASSSHASECTALNSRVPRVQLLLRLRSQYSPPAHKLSENKDAPPPSALAPDVQVGTADDGTSTSSCCRRPPLRPVAVRRPRGRARWCSGTIAPAPAASAPAAPAGPARGRERRRVVSARGAQELHGCELVTSLRGSRTTPRFALGVAGGHVGKDEIVGRILLDQRRSLGATSSGDAGVRVPRRRGSWRRQGSECGVAQVYALHPVHGVADEELSR